MWQLRRRREAMAAALRAYEESPPAQPANISMGMQAHPAEDIDGDWNMGMEEAIAAADAQEQQAKAALAQAAKCETLHPLTSYRFLLFLWDFLILVSRLGVDLDIATYADKERS